MCVTLEHVTLFCSRLHRGIFGSFARAIFSQDRPRGEIRSWLEPHGQLRQKLPGEHMATAFCYMLYISLSMFAKQADEQVACVVGQIKDKYA